MYRPKISVLMTSYNQEKFIKKAIDSVLQQDYDNFEIIISDDASTDQTPNIILEYCKFYPTKLVFIKNTERLGITLNSQRVLDYILKQRTSDLVTFLAGDDLWLPGKLSAQVKWFANNNNAVACYHDIIVLDIINQKIIDYYYAKVEGIAEKVLSYSCFAASQSIMLKYCHLPLNGYNKNLPHCSDWFLIVEALIQSNGYIGYISKAYAYYIKHHNNITITNKKLYLEIIGAYKQYKNNYPKYSKQFDFCLAKEAIVGLYIFIKNLDLYAAYYCLKEFLNTSSKFKVLHKILINKLCKLIYYGKNKNLIRLKENIC